MDRRDAELTDSLLEGSENLIWCSKRVWTGVTEKVDVGPPQRRE